MTGHYNARVLIESSAPTRIDLAGGTIDLWPLYLFHERAQTINCAITLRARCSLRGRRAGGLAIRLEDTGRELELAHWRDLEPANGFELVGRILRHFEADGLAVTTASDSPVGAGIAGSSALNIALCAALARWQQRALTDADLLQIAMNVEAQAIRAPTGVQDYRPALYGGVSAVELGVEGVTRVALDVPARALESRLTLAYTGASRQSGINNWEIFKRHLDGDRVVFGLFEDIRDAACAMREALTRGDWDEVGRQMAREWDTRKRLAPGVTTPQIETLVAAATAAGATAAKVCGAGGGGCLVCYSDPAVRPAVAAALDGAGARVLAAGIDREGLRVVVEAAAPA
jgi:D-glycero-alpha-D-manno-heptose-7-phosphate kinase